MPEEPLHPSHEASDRALPRRSLLRLGAIGLAGAAGAAHALDQVACTPSPTQTPGPFWVDGMLHRWDIRPDTKTGAIQPGLPMQLSMNISSVASGVCEPLRGGDIWVDIWHCSAMGQYSDVSQKGTDGVDWLRGYQLADDHGNVRFLSVFPGWYPGRTIHVHFRVRRFVDGIMDFNFVSQLYFEQALTTAVHDEIDPYLTRGQPNVTNAQDFGFDEALVMRTNYNGDRVMATFNVVVDPGAPLASGQPTPTDAHALEHLLDFGGGAPTYVSRFA
ncbi:MAG: hypothetical protein MK101_02865 [Phycisphaerales bacterium]|nr:hypothetical protein [Phycisphaerales bacterium]